jgi:cell shape-determining protein MreD
VAMALYVYLGLRYLSEPIQKLYNNNLNWYAAAVILLILIQAVVLEFIVSFLLRSLGIFKIKD